MLNYKDISEYRAPRWELLPDIDLYMDQVLVVLDKYLSIFKESEEDKILTSAMINNYVKQKITPAPVNKKYTRYHIAFIYIVCVLKNYISLSEICAGISVLLEGRHTAEAFDMFCSSLDGAIDEIFRGKKAERAEASTAADKILKAVTTAVADMLYVKCLVAENSGDRTE